LLLAKGKAGAAAWLLGDLTTGDFLQQSIAETPLLE
jgi:hypothetical protein